MTELEKLTKDANAKWEAYEDLMNEAYTAFGVAIEARKLVKNLRNTKTKNINCEVEY